MIVLKTPRGLSVEVPEVLEEDPSARFGPEDKDAVKRYYEENGYAVVTGLMGAAACDYIRELWNREVKPFQGFMYRQATAKAERHAFNANGWVMNPILNLQSVDPNAFPQFRRFATEEILAAVGLREAFTNLFGEPPKVVQSMYFEGNSATWEHQDSYYLDSENVGEMAGVWIALEDISARAGRFFVCPQSHRVQLEEHNIQNNIGENHERYIQSVAEKIRELALEIRAPVLRKGDALFWNAWTIHGSLDSQDADHSRSSITCHAIPRSRKFLQMQMRVQDVPTEDIRGTLVYRPKDLALQRNRMILAFESTLPGIYYFLKRKAINFHLKRKPAIARDASSMA